MVGVIISLLVTIFVVRILLKKVNNPCLKAEACIALID